MDEGVFTEYESILRMSCGVELCSQSEDATLSEGIHQAVSTLSVFASRIKFCICWFASGTLIYSVNKSNTLSCATYYESYMKVDIGQSYILHIYLPYVIKKYTKNKGSMKVSSSLYAFTFIIVCSDIRYDLRMKRMFVRFTFGCL
jgi:hypothetical protein